MRAASYALCGLGIVFAGWQPAHGHDARPLSIGLFEQSGNVYRARIRVPPSVELINQPLLTWPDGCESVTRADGLRTAGFRLRASSALITCEETLEGQTIAFRYTLFNPSISTVVRFTPLEGPPRVAVLGPDTSEWVVPKTLSTLETARDYLLLGVEHILTGFDHLLFVAGLVLLAGTGRRILWVITGFTAAHSITLSLSALGFINLPIVAAEAAIALSILFLAHEIVRPRADGLAYRYPILVSSSFGLLHGLGFAAALAEIGLPQGEIATALLFFNLGVEVGQIAFVLLVIGIVKVSAGLDLAGHYARLGFRVPSVRTATAYAIGIPSAYWLFERIAEF